VLGDVKDKRILDVACGQGFFCREFARLGAKVIGVDISAELIKIARLQMPFHSDGGQARKDSSAKYYVAPADKLDFLKNESIDKITIILSIQNIENANDVIKEASRVLKPKGKLFIVLNHPAFRILKGLFFLALLLSLGGGWVSKERQEKPLNLAILFVEYLIASRSAGAAWLSWRARR